jgi:hypothetical protein
MCDECAARHLRAKVSKDHRIVKQEGKQAAIESLIKTRPTFCEKHPEKPVELYCEDCGLVICLICHSLSHNQHKCCDLSQASANFKMLLDPFTQSLEDCLKSCDTENKEVEKIKDDIHKDLELTQQEMNERVAEIRKIVDKRYEEEMAKVNNFKETKNKELETRVNEIDRQRTIIETLQLYKNELMTKGSPSDIARSGKDLLARCSEVVKSQSEFSKSKPTCDKVIFVKTNISDITEGRINLLGNLQFNGLWSHLDIFKGYY